MGGILNERQTQQIKAIRRQIQELDIDGWMCEGTEYEDNDGNIKCGHIFFNNDLDESFIADYDGNVLPGGSAPYLAQRPDLLKYAALEGQIRKIAEGTEIDLEEDYER